MTNLIFKIVTILILLVSSVAFAQDFQGKAIYQTKTTLDMDFAGSGIPADRIEMIKERMKSQLEKTYTLTFNKTASIYKEEEKLDQTAGGRGGMRFMMMGGGASGNYYKNTQTKTSSKESEFSGKNFLIKDNLVVYDWKMEQETKMIGQNLCFKATTVIEMPKRETNFRFGRRGSNEEDEEENKEPEMEQVIVTAWYTLDVPVSHGPGDYWGLPGLILEVAYANTNILCTKIIMNPKDKIEITEPSKGKEVSQKEYDEIIVEKMKEMRERMRNERQKGGNEGHRIRIGG
ncbi:GLPGLI family protein [Lutibacter oceani]|uniref:GLPGLI family protein n=1 Tax=Lutibacter oceani TaxID=1853311 RepID=A0A3D9RTG8_9FLAO|nr:GLPGLI family protein [Lutibacter oceani]REE83157.1 GLPGLI family protein [Lutibacter oceani]